MRFLEGNWHCKSGKLASWVTPARSVHRSWGVSVRDWRWRLRRLVIFQRELGYVIGNGWEWLYDAICDLNRFCFANLPVSVYHSCSDDSWCSSVCPKVVYGGVPGSPKNCQAQTVAPGKNLGRRGQGAKGQGAKGPRGQGAQVRRMSLTIFCLLMDLLPICGLSVESF